MDKTIIISSLRLYIARKNQKINRINRIVLTERNLDNLSNLKKGLRNNKSLIKRAEQQLLFFENFIFKRNNSQSEQLLDFLLHLNEKDLINNYDFDYEKEAKNYLKKYE